MKYFYILVLLPTILFAQSIVDARSEVNWSSDFEDAKKQAEMDDMHILVYFTGSDWCGPCIKLKKDLFKKEEFISLSREYVMVYVDIPRKKNILSAEQLEHNLALLPKLNKKGVFPHFAVLTFDEKVLDEFSGYNMDGEIGGHLAFLEKNK